MNYIRKRYFVLIFIVIVFSCYSLIQSMSDRAVEMFLTEKTDLMSLEYGAAYNHNRDIADLIFKTQINKLQVIELFKNREREKLYQHLLVNYKIFRHFNIRQLHFHLPNNDSFLRMHRPQKYGDNLSNVRATVKYVNENKKRIDGFEEGKVYNGFRFVYPLFEREEHIGSVEVSFSALSFVKDIMKSYKIKTNFLIDKRVVDEKLFQDELSNYIESPIPQYYFQKSILQYINIDFSKKILSERESDTLYNKIKEGKPFSKHDKDFGQIVTFMPIKNPISGNVTAAITFRSDDVFIVKESRYSLMLFLISTAIIGLILLLIYKELKNKQSLQQKVEERTKELLDLNKKLDEMAHIDSLTGAYNRHYLYEIADKLIPFVKREKQRLSVAMIDLDRFKDVNDTYGHAVGDDVLKRFVIEIKNSIRESDIFIRYGGEEFVLLLPNTDLNNAKIITEKLRKIIQECDKLEGIRFTASIGVTEFIISEDNLESMLKRSDEALYIAKNSGRNRVVCKS